MQIQILNLEQLFNCPYSPKFETNSASQYERHIVIKHPGYQDIAVAEQILADYNICNQQLFVMSYVDKKTICTIPIVIILATEIPTALAAHTQHMYWALD
jgi:hypothetical protein